MTKKDNKVHQAVALELAIHMSPAHPPPLPTVALYSLMARGTKEFLSLLVEHVCDNSPSLRELSCFVEEVCRGWLVFSRTTLSLDMILCSNTLS